MVTPNVLKFCWMYCSANCCGEVLSPDKNHPIRETTTMTLAAARYFQTCFVSGFVIGITFCSSKKVCGIALSFLPVIAF